MKALIKTFCRGAAIVVVFPLYGVHLLATWIRSPDESLESCSQCLSLIPGTLGNYVRNAFYRLSLEYCDPLSTICFGVLISKVSARIERNVYVGPRCMLGCVTLHEDVLLGPGVQITSGAAIHGFSSLETPIRNQPGKPCRVTVGRDSWIGAACVVMADIGCQSVVGANSTVTRPLPVRSIAVGSPAKVIGTRDEQTADHSDEPRTLPESESSVFNALKLDSPLSEKLGNPTQ